MGKSMRKDIIIQKNKPLDLPSEGFARPAQVAFAFGVSRGTLYNWIKRGIFPAPQKFGNSMTVWPVDVVRAHLEQFRAGTTA